MQLRKHGTARYRSGGMIGPAHWKIHDLIILLEGSFTFHTPWSGLEIIAGDAVIIPPKIGFHATAGKHGGHIWVGHFSLGNRKESKWLRSAPHPPIWHFPAAAVPPWNQALLKRINSTFPTGGAAQECQRLFPLLLEAIRNNSGHPAQSPFRRAIKQAEETGWKGITTEKLAIWAGYSVSHFRTRFEQEYGEPIGRYLRNRRLEAACRLLQDVSLPIKQISDQLGYSTPSAFHHAFLSVHGCPPGEYRRRTAIFPFSITSA